MKNDITYLRADLEQMPTQRVDDVLQEELQKDPVDERTVRMILSVLENRESDHLESSAGIEAAWEKYLQQTASPETKPRRRRGRALKAASAVIVLLALASILPQEVEAKNFFERLISWTDSIFELLNPSDEDQAEYAFETDHPGLQEVYDTVMDLGVTVPVVPMWLPEGYELAGCEVVKTPVKTYLTATFSRDGSNAVYQLNIYSQNVADEYYKDKTAVDTHEWFGTTFNIMRNNNLWVVVWSKDNLECAIALDCQEDTLHKILESIYTMEDY